MSPRRRLHASPIRDAAPVASAPHHPRTGGLLSAISLAAICYATLVPAAQAPVTAPFCLICGDRGGVDAFLNFMLFVPLGARFLLAGLPTRRALVLMTLLSASIELTQGLAIPGRDASIGDLLFNSLGGAAGFALFSHARVILQPTPREAAHLTVMWCGVWLAIQAIVGYALTPSLPASPWFLQVGRKLPGHERFPGSIASVSIGTEPLHDGLLESSARVRARLLAASPLMATIQPAGTTRRTAPIIHLVDTNRRGILLLAQRGSSLLFTMRTGADRLRIRPPMIELAGALVPANPGEQAPLIVAARRERDALVMSLHRDGRDREYRVPLSTSLGWTLVFPAQWRLTNGMTEHLLSFTWLAALAFPLGWWAMRAPHQWKIVAIVAMGIGVGVLPLAFHLPFAAASEWSAAAFGVVLGGASCTVFARRRERVAPRHEFVERQPHNAAAPRHESATAQSPQTAC